MILIFGADGMLGSYVFTHLNQDYGMIVGLNRKNLDITATYKDGSLLTKLVKLIEEYRPEYVINCAGIIIQRNDI